MKIETVLRREIATGGDPAGALAAAVRELIPKSGGVYHASVAHDDGCPCVGSARSIRDCNCELVELTIGKRAAA